MLLAILIVSSLVHVYSISYMSYDPQWGLVRGKRGYGDKLSNSGKLLKLTIPNYSWKTISGWNNYSGRVIICKMSENEMDNRGSKSEFKLNQINLLKKIIFSFIIWFIIIGVIFLMINIHSFLGSWLLSSFYIDLVLLCAIVPIKRYSNVEANKSTIIEENKQKSGIYCWINKVNKKRYVGSAVDLSNRLLFYYLPSQIHYALTHSKSYIYSAIIKYGLQDFSLEILEYCSPDKLLIREKYYIDLGAEYNIIKNPTLPPMSGRTHSDSTKIIMSDNKKGENNPMYGKIGENHPKYGKTLNDDTKTKISDAQKGNTSGFKKGESRLEGAGRPSQVIEVTDITKNTTVSYNSIREAARALNIPSYKSISTFIKNNQQKPYKGRYTFKKVN